MIEAPLPPNEKARLAALESYNILDTGFEKDYDNLCRLAALICQTPIALISLIDKERQWFKASVGLETRQTPRQIAFCAHAIWQDHIFEVPDASQDERFFDNPLVTEAPQIRFYAGKPLINPEGFALGTLCAIDHVPRKLTSFQQEALEILSQQVVTHLELRRALTRVTKLNQDKDRFISLIAHDLRSPFSGMMGLVNIILEQSDQMDKPEILQYLVMVHKSMQHVYTLLEDLLKWAQLEQGQMNFHPQDWDVNDLFEKVLGPLNAAITRKKLSVEKDLPSGQMVTGDRNMLETSLRNLISNAIKFTRPGGQITLKAACDSHDWRLSVQDSGSGIREDQLERVRSGLMAQSYPGTEGEKGSGLGLTFVHQVAERHGGRLEITSEQGKGTLATLILPKKKA